MRQTCGGAGAAFFGKCDMDEKNGLFTCALGRCKAPLKKSHYVVVRQQNLEKSSFLLTKISLLSSPTLPNRYVRPSQ